MPSEYVLGIQRHWRERGNVIAQSDSACLVLVRHFSNPYTVYSSLPIEGMEPAGHRSRGFVKDFQALDGAMSYYMSIVSKLESH